MKPGTDLEQRITKQWGELGFQGDDPATDFRGMGMCEMRTNLSLTLCIVLASIAGNKTFCG